MSDLSSLSGRYAVVTGSTQGLGESTVRLLAERGLAGAIVTGRDEARGDAVVSDLKQAGCEAKFVQANLSSVDDCRRVIKTADETFGALHILVNAAALTVRGTIWDTTPELFDDMMALNIRAPFFLIQEAVKLMQRESIEGSIINVSSVASYGSLPMLCPYATSKGGLNILTKNTAFSLMRHRIRVNALAIGWMDTPGEDTIQRRFHSDGKDWLEEAEASMPFGRLLKTQEVARAIAWLASDESGMMTGAIIDFDQSVIGAGTQPIAAPMNEWTQVDGVSYA